MYIHIYIHVFIGRERRKREKRGENGADIEKKVERITPQKMGAPIASLAPQSILVTGTHLMTKLYLP